MKKKSKTKKLIETTEDQHVVPKCYLKPWCDDHGHLHAYKIDGGHLSYPSRKSAATRKFIYDIEETLNDTDPANYQIFERTFGKIESKAKRVFESIIAHARRADRSIIIPPECLRISDDLAEQIIRLTVIQCLRDERYRKRVEAHWNDWLQQVWDATVPLQFSPSEDPDIEFKTVDKDFLTFWLIQYLKDRLSKFSAAFRDKTMVIGLNRTAKKLLTSDSPVHWTGYYIDASSNWDGINSRTSRTVYPLAPDVCVIFFDPKFYVGERVFHRSVRTLMPSEVEQFNHHMALQSDQQIFSADGDFSHAEAAFADRRISGAKWGTTRSSPIPQYLLNLCIYAGQVKKYTKAEWKRFVEQGAGLDSALLGQLSQELLDAFSEASRAGTTG